MAAASLQPRLRQAAQQGDVHTLTHAMFGLDLAPFQVDIVREIAWKTTPRVCVTAPTQSGKSRAVAAGTALLMTWHSGPLTVAVVAPKLDQTKKVRNYFAGHVADSPLLAAQLEDAQAGDTADRLRKEASKRRITFQNGKELQTHTAGGSLMSQGADVVILDEAGELSAEQYGEARRMIGGATGHGRLIEIGNPWSPTSPFAESFDDPRYTVLRTTWEEAVEQGRLAREYVEEQRERISSLLFTVYYESRFPETAEDALYQWGWIRNATRRDQVTGDDAESRWALDVAEGGADHNVLIHALVEREALDVLDVWTWDESDTENTVTRVKGHVPEEDPVTVDALGVGKGVADGLKKAGWKVHEFKASNKARDDDYANRKAELAYTLRDRLEDGTISLPDHDRLVDDLRRIRRDIRSGRIHVTNEGGKSPDWFSALYMVLDRRAGRSAWSPL